MAWKTHENAAAPYSWLFADIHACRSRVVLQSSGYASSITFSLSRLSLRAIFLRRHPTPVSFKRRSVLVPFILEQTSDRKANMSSICFGLKIIEFEGKWCRCTNYLVENKKVDILSARKAINRSTRAARLVTTNSMPKHNYIRNIGKVTGMKRC